MYPWKVYLVRCSDNSLYCGIAKNVETRIIAHNNGKGAKYTRSRRPVKLAAVSNKMTKSEALAFEYFIKQLPANKKINAFIETDHRMKHLIIELQSIAKGIKKLQTKLEKVIEAIEKEEKPKVAKRGAAKKKAAPKKTKR